MRASCTGGRCGVEPAPAGTRAADPTFGDCHGVECDGYGASNVVEDRSDTGDDWNSCTAHACGPNGPTSQALDGQSCGSGTCAGAVCVGDRIAIDANLHHSCLVANDGAVFCWGANESGQLGDGTLQNRPAPVHVPGIGVGGLGAAVQVSVGYAHSCARLGDGTVACWGNNLGGQVGNRKTADAVVEPTVVKGVTAIHIAAGYGHTCAVISGGDVVCWGACLSGECGVPAAAGAAVLEPTRVAGISNARAVFARKLHTCALVGGDAWCWGENRYGQLGRGTVSTTPNPTPERVVGVPPIVALGVSWSTTCAVSSDLGSVWCWGDNQRGQLSFDPDPATTAWESSPVPVEIRDPDSSGRLTMARMVFGGAGSHICATGSWVDRRPICWGGSDKGEIPTDGSTTLFEKGMPVRSAFDQWTTALALGENHTCAVVSASTGQIDVRCTGDNTFGETGTGSFGGPIGLPAPLAWPR
jgi:alpha-tubulin suppressor-like RCC1 family protein